MSAYWICVYREISDQAKVTAYAELAGLAIRDGGGRFLALGDGAVRDLRVVPAAE